MVLVLFEGDKPARCAGALVLEGLARYPGCHVGLRLGGRQAVALADLGDELRLVLDLRQIQVRERRPFLLGIRPVSCEPSQGALTLAASKAEYVILLHASSTLRIFDLQIRDISVILKP